MKNNIIRLLLFAAAFVVSISGCRSVRQPVTTNAIETTKTITIIDRDTVFEVKADSSFYRAWIDCVNGKPVITKVDTLYSTSGKYLEKPNVKLNGNQLQVDCKAKAQELFAQWKEKYIKEQQKEVITLPPIEVEKQLNWWQITQIWAGRILFLLLAVLLGFALFKKYLKPI